MTTAYATVAELSAQTTIDLTKYTAHVTPLILACSAAINNACHRPDGFIADTVASARTFPGSGMSYQEIPECVEITSVEAKNSLSDTSYVSWSADDWIAYRGSPKRPNFNPLASDEPMPFTGIMLAYNSDRSYFINGKVNTAREGFPPLNVYGRLQPHFMLQPTVRITAKWGYAVAVPNAIRQATIIQASRFFKRSQAQWSDALVNQEFGSLQIVNATDPAYDYLLKHKFIKPVV